MINRTTLFKKYLTSTDVDKWFIDHVLPTPAMVNSVARASASDFASGVITYDEFSLVCVNLHFQAILRFGHVERAAVEAVVSRLARLFADPGKDDVDQERHLREELQQKLLQPLICESAA